MYLSKVFYINLFVNEGYIISTNHECKQLNTNEFSKGKNAGSGHAAVFTKGLIYKGIHI